MGDDAQAYEQRGRQCRDDRQDIDRKAFHCNLLERAKKNARELDSRAYMRVGSVLSSEDRTTGRERHGPMYMRCVGERQE